MATDIRARASLGDQIIDAADLLSGALDSNNELTREELGHLREALFTSEAKIINGGFGFGTMADGLYEIASGLHAIAAAIRGDARPVVRHEHVRAPKPEPEGDTGPQVTKVDKRRSAA